MKTLIKGGRVIDPANNFDKQADVLIENDKIVAVAKNIKVIADKIIDATNLIVVPGLIDVHTHLREPGREEAETIATGTCAAAKGGFTTVLCMPNTKPALDNAPAVEFVLLKAQKEGLVNVHPIGCITRGSAGEELAEIGVLKKAGVVAISDDGSPVSNSLVMRRALEYAKMFKLPVIAHCEDKNLAKNGVMNEGFTSTLLGLRGIPPQAEDIMVSRDVMLAQLTGGHLHVAHISTAGSVDIVRQAKKKKINVTAETCPHYFSLTDEAVKGYSTSTKMNPPLRTAADVEAIKEGLADGTIDCVASDHAPHTREEKSREFDIAPFGIIGLETMLSLSIMNLVDTKILSLKQLIAKFTSNPARIFALTDRGSLSKGKRADITIIDPSKVFVANSFISKSSNSPFLGKKLKGVAEYTIVGGKTVWSHKEGIIY